MSCHCHTYITTRQALFCYFVYNGDMKRLDERVREMLLARRGEWHGIADTASVSHSWLSKFVNGRFANPGYETLLRVLAALDTTDDCNRGHTAGQA